MADFARIVPFVPWENDGPLAIIPCSSTFIYTPYTKARAPAGRFWRICWVGRPLPPRRRRDTRIGRFAIPVRHPGGQHGGVPGNRSPLWTGGAQRRLHAERATPTLHRCFGRVHDVFGICVRNMVPRSRACVAIGGSKHRRSSRARNRGGLDRPPRLNPRVQVARDDGRSIRNPYISN